MEEGSQLAGLENVLSGLSKNPELISTLVRLVNNGGTQQSAPSPQSSEANFANTSELETIIKLLTASDGAVPNSDRSQNTNAAEASKAERHQNIPDIESILRALSVAQGAPKLNQRVHNGTNDILNTVRQTLGGKEESENRIRLLNALRPYLCDERRNKLDVLIRVLRIVELGELRGLLGIR